MVWWEWLIALAAWAGIAGLVLLGLPAMWDVHKSEWDEWRRY